MDSTGSKLEKWTDRRNLKVPPLSDDYAFIRRVYFDTLGLPPTPNEIRNFVSDQDPRNERRLSINLLKR